MIRTSTLALAMFGLAACAPQTTSNSQTKMTSHSESQQANSGFDKTLANARTKLDAAMAAPLIVPVPKDPGGGLTHETHKANYSLIYNAGQIYELTGDKKYADFAGQAMLDYADVYPGWGLHPAKKEQSPGRMFWQNLNESMFLLHVAQSYDAIKETLTDAEREKIETGLLRNMADFLSVGAPETFDKVHNHGTWATAAVGLTGYAIGDEDYVEQALLGLDKSGEAGFLKQMDVLFSPDGYYNEGPYYQRFALKPFVIFAQAVQKNNPELKIFEKRDGILKKATYSLIHQNYGGLFFPINDAIKEKGIKTDELLHGVAIAYELTGDTGLLSIAGEQDTFVLTPESRKLSQDLAAGKATPFDYKSMRLTDGQQGTEGALDILRVSDDPDDQALVMKHTSQGLGHGHFDKLGLLYYDNGNEILRDYAAARFLNIEAKYGGHYLPENNLYAKQTIAHNAIVVDETSHFNGNTATGNQFAPKLGPFITTPDLQLSSASTSDAYPGIELSRKTAIITDAAFSRPIIIDVMQAKSTSSHQYDLPFHYNGQLIDTNFEISADSQSRSPLGEKNGYQYIWKTGQAEPVNDLSQLTFLLDDRFYTLSTATPDNTTILLGETGANDPNFNLRRETALILRAENQNDASFVTVIESHGEYDPTLEFTINSHSSVASVSHREETGYDRVDILSKTGQTVTLLLADSDGEFETTDASGNSIKWQGPAHLLKSK